MFKNALLYRIEQWNSPTIADLESRLSGARFVESKPPRGAKSASRPLRAGRPASPGKPAGPRKLARPGNKPITPRKHR